MNSFNKKISFVLLFFCVFCVSDNSQKQYKMLHNNKQKNIHKYAQKNYKYTPIDNCNFFLHL